MKVFIICAIIGMAVCEKLPSQQQAGPYSPSGWKPSGAQLALPLEYGQPQAFRQPDIQVTAERVQFAGQQQATESTTQLSNEYLPPAPADSPDQVRLTTDVLRVQGLPSAPPAKFNRQQLNTGEILPLQQLQQQRYNLVRNQQLQQYRLNQLRQQQQQQQQQQNRLQAAARPTFGQLNQQSSQRPTQQQQQRIQFQKQQQQQQQQPQQQYGAPQPEQPQQPSNQYGPPANPQQFNPAAEQPQQPEQNFDADSETEDVEGPSVAVANAVNNGQYYILADDSTLQRVVYMTSQTEDDRRNNGFTAQLRYAPVEPIRDPIYAYDAQGQLVRIYNK